VLVSWNYGIFLEFSYTFHAFEMLPKPAYSMLDGGYGSNGNDFGRLYSA
jgi:hypothetical protein